MRQAFMGRVGTPQMFTEWIRRLMVYEGKSFVSMQWSVKLENIRRPGTPSRRAQHIPGPGALLTGAQWWHYPEPSCAQGAFFKHTLCKISPTGQAAAENRRQSEWAAFLTEAVYTFAA